MKTLKTGFYLRPLRELDAEIALLQNYCKKLLQARELRLEVALAQAGDGGPGLLEMLVEITAKVRLCGKSQMYARTREQPVCESRFIVFLVAREHTRLSLETIAKHFQMDHGSVLHGCTRARQLKSVDRQFARDFQTVADQFLAALDRGAAATTPNPIPETN